MLGWPDETGYMLTIPAKQDLNNGSDHSVFGVYFLFAAGSRSTMRGTMYSLSHVDVTLGCCMHNFTHGANLGNLLSSSIAVANRDGKIMSLQKSTRRRVKGVVIACHWWNVGVSFEIVVGEMERTRCLPRRQSTPYCLQSMVLCYRYPHRTTTARSPCPATEGSHRQSSLAAHRDPHQPA